MPGQGPEPCGGLPLRRRQQGDRDRWPGHDLVDRLTVTPTEGTLSARTYEAGDATLAGSNGNTAAFTVTVEKKGRNTIGFRSEGMPNFDGTTYASDTFPGVLLRSSYAPLIDRITVRTRGPLTHGRPAPGVTWSLRGRALTGFEGLTVTWPPEWRSAYSARFCPHRRSPGAGRRGRTPRR